MNMKSFFKKMIRSSIIKAAKLAGLDVDIVIARSKHNADFTFIDRNSLEAYFHNNDNVICYKESLKLSGMTETDHFLKQSRYYRLQQMLKIVLHKGISGNVAECGCWKGHSSYIIAKILADNNFIGQFSIFDSFELGLSEKTPKDINQRVKMNKDEIQKEKEMFSSTEHNLHTVLKPFNFYKTYKGWIPERFEEVSEEEFIFVHIDVDLYQPTLDSLEFFYPRLKKGGIIIVDDYGYTQFPGAKKCIDEFLSRNKCDLFYEGSTGGCFILK